jgi:hypothetical protein
MRVCSACGLLVYAHRVSWCTMCVYTSPFIRVQYTFQWVLLEGTNYGSYFPCTPEGTNYDFYSPPDSIVKAYYEVGYKLL